jgi:hypothetical protein
MTLGCGRVGYDAVAVDVIDAGSVSDPDSAPPAVCPDILSDVDCRLSECADTQVCNELALLLHLDDESGADASGQGNTAVCGASCPTWVSGGRFAGAYRFSDPEYLEVANDVSLDAPDQVTISVWFFANSFPADFAPIVTKWVPTPEQSNYRVAQNGQQFYVNYNNANGWQNHPSVIQHETGRWYHLVGQIDDLTDTVRLFVDGALIVETTNTEELELDGGSIFIGWAENELGVDGLIDEVAMWTRILSETEIAALY